MFTVTGRNRVRADRLREQTTALPPHAGDIVLIERMVARDERALSELYDGHCRVLFGLIVRILRDRSESEDVLQEVFVLAWTRADTYDVSLEPPAAWLVRLARNRALDRLRANNVRASDVDGEPAPVEHLESQAGVSEQQRACASALDTLPPDQRALIEQAYFLGLTHSELAERFQLPLCTVKMLIRTGMVALREQLSQISIEE